MRFVTTRTAVHIDICQIYFCASLKNILQQYFLNELPLRFPLAFPDIKRRLKIEPNAGNATSKCEIKSAKSKRKMWFFNVGGNCFHNWIHFCLQLYFNDRLRPGESFGQSSLPSSIVSDWKSEHFSASRKCLAHSEFLIVLPHKQEKNRK